MIDNLSKEIALLKIENKKRKEKIKLNSNNNFTKLPNFISEIIVQKQTPFEENYPLFLVIFFSALGYIFGYLFQK